MAFDYSGGMPHHQCSRCKKLYRGPHAGANPGADVTYVSEAGEMEDNPERPLSERNVSHGMCEDCYPAWLDEARADVERRRSRQAARAEQPVAEGEGE